jgi:hypothetical protein
VDKKSTVWEMQPATGPAKNTFPRFPFEGDEDSFWEETVSTWRSKQKPESVALLVLAALEEAVQIERKLTASRESLQPDPIELGIHRTAERIQSLEREVNPVRVHRLEGHKNKPQSQPRKR